ncbi:hypothetical protein DL98DRAFT_162481 [Cadophora sp. DSE1049]|nr:hypothetical protein DL98DRAFT_162481 [Cadophora sp. DSE1049]
MSSLEPVDAGSASSSTPHLFKYDQLAEPESEIRLLRILPKDDPAKMPAKSHARCDHDAIARDVDALAASMVQSSALSDLHASLDMGPAEVHCEIFHVTMEDAPPYKALSYIWGSPDDPQYPIFLNGRTILVRETLWFALKQFHTRPRPLVIWIDAVCINQADDMERNEQVTKMKTIYEQAEEVCVWLGPGYEDSHLAFQFMQEMYDHRNDVQWIDQRFAQPEAKEALVALDDLLGRNYWWRMWIVQELVSAKFISLHCGAAAIGAVALDETQSLFRAMQSRERGFNGDHLFNLMPAEVDSRVRLMYRGMYDVRIFQNAFEAQTLSFFQTLLYNWQRETTEPRDMVYGLAALANYRSKYQISIDYSRSASEIYIDLAKKEFQHCTTLEILTMARSGSNLPGLPSWVPDWSRRDLHFFLHDITVPQFAYSAAGERSCNISFADAGDTLVLQGVVIGKVNIVGDRHNLENAGQAFLSWWALLGTTGDRGERRQEQFGRTLICDKLTDREYSGWSREDACRSVLGRFVDFISDDLPVEEIESELISARSWMVQRYKDIHRLYGNEDGEEIMQNINRSWIQGSAEFIWDRRFFLGSSNIMGLATEGVEGGDIICVPLGCPHPMIFRKVEDHYVVIGEAYVDGYMRGKAIEMLENGELELETFELH